MQSKKYLILAALLTISMLQAHAIPESIDQDGDKAKGIMHISADRSITIPLGTTIMWYNESDEPQQVASIDMLDEPQDGKNFIENGLFKSDIIPPHTVDGFSFKFDTVGSFTYYNPLAQKPVIQTIDVKAPIQKKAQDDTKDSFGNDIQQAVAPDVTFGISDKTDASLAFGGSNSTSVEFGSSNSTQPVLGESSATNSATLLAAEKPISMDQVSKMPQWVKSVFRAYGAGDITDDEMLEAVKFLVKAGVIELKTK